MMSTPLMAWVNLAANAAMRPRATGALTDPCACAFYLMVKRYEPLSLLSRAPPVHQVEGVDHRISDTCTFLGLAVDARFLAI